MLHRELATRMAGAPYLIALFIRRAARAYQWQMVRMDRLLARLPNCPATVE